MFRYRGDVVILDSVNLFLILFGGYCLIFWYYMFGNNIGSFNIYLVINFNRILFWFRNGI